MNISFSRYCQIYGFGIYKENNIDHHLLEMVYHRNFDFMNQYPQQIYNFFLFIANKIVDGKRLIIDNTLQLKFLHLAIQFMKVIDLNEELSVKVCIYLNCKMADYIFSSGYVTDLFLVNGGFVNNFSALKRL